MDLNQRKLTKNEWNNIERPVSDIEKEIITLIKNGYNDVNIKYNNFNSLISFLKIECQENMEDYLYNRYFSKIIQDFKIKYNVQHGIFNIVVKSNVVIKKADMIRIDKNDQEKIKSKCFEMTLINIIEELLKSLKLNNKKWSIHYFTLDKLIKLNITNINRHIITLIQKLICSLEDNISMIEIIENSVEFIENNSLLLKYADINLYEHQKELFTIMKIQEPKLILYIAPTGTGKTLSPIGLSETNKVIFLCAARHVGIALAKSAISVGKKIAFAFGCESAEDIRLHYFAAKEFKVNKRTGGIGKVDNSIGDKVEIIICDIKSYLTAMYYMLAFNKASNIITYWDEPTITMDYETHELHEIITRNWRENLIPNMILSSATLPKLHELTETVASFKEKFTGSQVHNIVSDDCKKSIPLIDKNGYVILPHYLSDNYQNILEIVNNCKNNLSLLRYFDLKEVIEFIIYIEKNNIVPINSTIIRYFNNMDDVNMKNIKLHYLRLLEKIPSEQWNNIYELFKSDRKLRIQSNDNMDQFGYYIKKKGIGANFTKSCSDIADQSLQIQPELTPVQSQVGIYITTKDAFTLSDGPTIFLANDVEKIAKFCIQQAAIPLKVMSDIVEKIEFNNKLNCNIDNLEQELEYLMEKLPEKDESESSTNTKEGRFKTNVNSDMVLKEKLQSEMDHLKTLIKSAQLNETFIPNKPSHIKKWADDNLLKTTNAYTSDVDEHSIINIMMLKDVDDSWKILLLMGIGVFTNHPSIAYTEIMKKLAEEQKLYLIIASSDYIYGTNYQFCHGYLSKDLCLTQEKIIQALGRIGRNNIQQNYSIRLRDEEQINKLFYIEMDKIEVRVMNTLFHT